MFEHLLRTPKVHDVTMRFLTEANSGEFDLGKSLPSVRNLAARYDVSIFTVHRALDELKKAGFIQTKGKKAAYINGAAISRIGENENLREENGASVALLVRRYSDLRKLGSSLLREKTHQKLNSVYPEIKIKEIQTSLTGESAQVEVFNMMLSDSKPTLGILPQTCLDVYCDFKLLGEINTDCFSERLKKVKEEYKNLCKRDGKLYLMPNSATFSFLLYNKKILLSHGIGPENFNSMEAFYDFLRHLKKNGTAHPLAMGFGADMFYLLMLLIYQTHKDLKLNEKAPQIDWIYENIREGMDLFCSLAFKEELASASVPDIELIPKLIKGDVPFCFDSGHTAGAVIQSGEAYKIGIMPFPSGMNKFQFSLANVSGFFINSKASPKEAEAGCKYISHWLDLFCHSAEGARLELQYARGQNFFSVLKDEFRDFSIYESMPDDWPNALSNIAARPVFEASGADWEKTQAAKIFKRLLEENAKPEPDEMTLYLNSKINNAKFWEEK